MIIRIDVENMEIDFDYLINCVSSEMGDVEKVLNGRGYLYLNQIYEILGVKWEPLEIDNHIWLKDDEFGWSVIPVKTKRTVIVLVYLSDD